MSLSEMPVLPATWVAIAERSRSVANGLEQLTWTEHPRSVMTIQQAKEYVAAGSLLMANQHTDEKILLVVRPVTRRQRR